MIHLIIGYNFLLVLKAGPLVPQESAAPPSPPPEVPDKTPDGDEVEKKTMVLCGFI